MRLTKLSIQNYQQHRDFTHDFTRPVTLFCGPNDAGKTTIANAIRYALTGVLDVGTKRERAELISPGAKDGSVTLGWDGGSAGRSVKTGKGGVNSDPLPPCLEYVIDPTLFSGLPAGERGRALTNLMDIDLGSRAIMERLLGRDIGKKYVDEIETPLHDGFALAASYATAQASESRGAWKAVTGETYGSTKAETWTRDIPEPDPDELAAVIHAKELVEKTAQALRDEAAKLRAETDAQADLAKRIADLKAQQKLGPAANKALEQAEKDLADAKAKAETARVAYVDARTRCTPTTYECPECGATLQWISGELVKHEQIDTVSTEDLFELETTAIELAKLADTAEHNVTEKRAELDKARAARDALKAIDAPTETKDHAARLAEIQTEIADAEKDLNGLRTEQRALETVVADATSAQQAAKTAKGYHRDVVQWVALADALGPNGIPAELAAESIGPINERLRESAAATGWDQVQISPDMEITSGPYRYARCGKSRQWRADAMLAEAISHLSGLRMIVLDEVDILEPASRKPLLRWLTKLAENEQIETAILMATLKAPPTLPDQIDVRWIGPKIEENAA